MRLLDWILGRDRRPSAHPHTVEEVDRTRQERAEHQPEVDELRRRLNALQIRAAVRARKAAEG